MAGTYSKVKTVVTGETITAADRNAEHDNHISNADPDGIGDASADNTEMQAVADPYPASSESLATDLRGELQRLRFLIKQITGKSQWYIDPDNVLYAYLDEDNFASNSATQAPTQQSTKAYVDARTVTNGNSHDHNGGDGAQIPTGGIAASAVTAAKATSLLGAYAAKTIGTIYQAATDGFVTAYAEKSSGVTLTGKTDSAATPTTVRAVDTANTAGDYASVTYPVRNGEYYQVSQSATPDNSGMYFVPLGS